MIGIGATLFKRMASGSRFSPASLFRDGEEGAWYDPSDLSTLFQEDGTTPAVVDGIVGKVLDKSGNGNHIVQTTDTKCPILKQDGSLYYLDFDGTDDGLKTSSNIDFTGTDAMSVFAGARKESDVTAVIAELSDNIGGVANTGAFRINAVAGNNWRYTSKGTNLVNSTAINYTPPVTSVLTGLSDISDDSVIIRVDGTQEGSSSSDQGIGNYGNHPLNVGARNGGAGLKLDGRIYGFIVRGASSTASDIASTEAYMALKTGVSI